MDTVEETTVNDSGSVAIPAAVRESADIESGDKLRWRVDDDGVVSVERIRQRAGAFDDFEPFDGDEETNAVEDKRTAGLD
jgi:antitoxin PrlF